MSSSAHDKMKLCSTDSLPPGTMKRFAHGSSDILLVNLSGTIVALSNWCTHESADLSKGDIQDGNCVVCPDHAARFDLRTGDVLEGPIGEEKSAISKLQTFEISIDHGEVYVNV